MRTSSIGLILRLVFLLGGAALAAAPCTAAQPVPATTRKVVLAKVDKGYRWQRVSSAPVPQVGDHQVWSSSTQLSNIRKQVTSSAKLCSVSR
jgi:hypothetical protein